MKTILPYVVENCLSELIKQEQKKRLKIGQKVKLESIEKELSEHCGISLNGIRRIKRGLCYPSIETAFGIVTFFNVRFKDVFRLSDIV